jgi:hypothetical protein
MLNTASESSLSFDKFSFDEAEYNLTGLGTNGRRAEQNKGMALVLRLSAKDHPTT